MPKTPGAIRPGPAPAARRLGQGEDGVLVRVHAPGRVNLIGDHTDYAGGWVLPMAIDRGTTIEYRRSGERVQLVSSAEPAAVTLDLSGEAGAGAGAGAAGWGRYAAGVLATYGQARGGFGLVHSDLPIGAGLSSSSSLTVAFALAVGFEGTALELARLCQEAETLGSGVPGGIMDQLCSAAGRSGHALLIDCTNLEVEAVALPLSAEVLVAHSGQPRTLVGSAYADRRNDCELAAAEIGPLRDATEADVERITEDRLRRRARHVVSENARVLEAAAALKSGDLAGAGRLMDASHRSLAADFDVSTPALDQLADTLRALPGVFGARLTGAGFGGCVVALAESGTAERLAGLGLPGPAWQVRASDGASVEVLSRLAA
ncbi:MAG TPA: galactokinase [Acidimicrobiales bacterium]|nr:galactokinase [Acidimicrobiales bacterium]